MCIPTRNAVVKCYQRIEIVVLNGATIFLFCRFICSFLKMIALTGIFAGAVQGVVLFTDWHCLRFLGLNFILSETL